MGRDLRELGAAVNPATYGVTVVGHEVFFDAERDLWYADVALTLPELAFPFVRLALVRFQPVSVNGCHVSSVVHADFAQLLPKRTLTVTRLDAASMQIAFSGPKMQASKATAQFHRRVAPDITLGLGQPLNLTQSGASAQTFAGTLHLPPPPTGPQPQLTGPDDGVADPPAAALAGRVVVRELQTGWSLTSTQDTERTVYLETFDTALVLPAV
jgi:hypothetical protein